MDTSKLPEARIERERYVLAVFNCGVRSYYTTSSWSVYLKDATKHSTQLEALQAIEAYGRTYHNDTHTRHWEIWLITESKPRALTWVIDSEQQII